MLSFSNARSDQESLEHEEVLPDLNRADALKPDDAIALYLRGATKSALGTYEEALQDLNQADALKPNTAFTLSWRGSTKRALGKYEEALQVRGGPARPEAGKCPGVLSIPKSSVAEEDKDLL